MSNLPDPMPRATLLYMYRTFTVAGHVAYT